MLGKSLRNRRSTALSELHGQSYRGKSHIGEMQNLVFGPPPDGPAVSGSAVLAELSNASFDVLLASQVEQDMWQKWVFIASSAGITSLMRGAVGDIVEAGGASLAEQLVEECSAIAAANGHPPSEESRKRTLVMLTAPGSPMTTSVFRGIEAGNRIEADHIIGDLIQRAPNTIDPSLLHIVLVALKTYEARQLGL